jgi:hypothetical protein
MVGTLFGFLLIASIQKNKSSRIVDAGRLVVRIGGKVTQEIRWSNLAVREIARCPIE